MLACRSPPGLLRRSRMSPRSGAPLSSYSSSSAAASSFEVRLLRRNCEMRTKPMPSGPSAARTDGELISSRTITTSKSSRSSLLSRTIDRVTGVPGVPRMRSAAALTAMPSVLSPSISTMKSLARSPLRAAGESSMGETTRMRPRSWSMYRPTPPYRPCSELLNFSKYSLLR